MGSKASEPLLARPDGYPVTRMSIDDMLSGYAGDFGRWQLRHFLLTSAAWALEALHTMVMIFSDREPGRVCTGADCTSLDPCRPGSGWEWVGGPGSSIVAEWGLVCGEKYKVGLVQAVFFAGCMVGAGVFGHLSDSSLGRKGSLTVVCALNTIFGLLTSIAPSYWVYTLLRFLTGFSTGGVGLCAFVLATEPVGPSKRGAAGMSTFYFFSGGIAILAGIAYQFQSWRPLYVVTSLPSLLFFLAIIPFLSESPRWYLVRGKVNEAVNVMRDISRTNGKEIPHHYSLKLDDEDSEDKEAGQQQNKVSSGSILDVLRSRVTRVRLILSVAINLLCSIVYYGLSLNVVNLKTNLYASVLLNSLAEIPAYALTALLLDRFGRKPLAIGTMILSGVFCTIGLLVGVFGEMEVTRMVCGVVGIFGMAATYNLLFIYTAELFPTVVRNVALGCTAQACQLGAIVAPFVVVLGESVPFAVFGVSGILGGILVCYLPETMNQPLYDTMAGIEEGEREILK
ncbi:Organic cation/carnitine transporter 4 [Rhynchospora pubera]|uniref:H(+)/Pi cotransporter n=1 Tax=Rhynchospora pubera TaxID=906938 RepID=A0AAV8D6H5_9POAL|nr:Organic cation/carnitine transporter 4 [Rhynchospora pubera]